MMVVLFEMLEAGEKKNEIGKNQIVKETDPNSHDANIKTRVNA